MLKTYCVLAILAASASPAQTRECVVDIYVRSDVLTPPGMLMAASSRMVEMFRDIGVEVRMMKTRATEVATGDCHIPIRIVVTNAGRIGPSPKTLAAALPFSRSGDRIRIFLDHISKPSLMQMTDTFAYVLTHEIAHVIEGLEHHSPHGIMKANWDYMDYSAMRNRTLGFETPDVRLIQDGIEYELRRISAARETKAALH